MRGQGLNDLPYRELERRSSHHRGIFFEVTYWLITRNVEWTDDTYTDGRTVTIAPQVSGLVVSLDVTDNEFVHKGQALDRASP
jgi:multidrug resistance efflux pump